MEQVNTEKLKDILESLQVDQMDSSIIQDNKLIFDVEDKTFRATMPNQYQYSRAEEYRNEEYIKLLNTGKHKTKNQLIKLLLEKQDIDVNALEAERLKYQEQTKDAYLELATKLSDDFKSITALKDKIEELKTKWFNLSMEISTLLSPSIEDQMEKKYIEYLTFLCTEKLVTDNTGDFEKVWLSMDEFFSDNSVLANKAVIALTHLLTNSRD